MRYRVMVGGHLVATYMMAWDQVMDFVGVFNAFVSILASKEVGVVTTVFAIISFFISIAAYRRTTKVLESQENNMYVEQSRFLDNQWQQLIHLILSDRDFSDWVTKQFPEIYGEDAQTSALQYWLANVLSTAYHSYRFKLIENDKFEAHLFSVWLFWRRDSKRLIAFLRAGYQSKSFVSECEAALARIEARNCSKVATGVSTGADGSAVLGDQSNEVRSSSPPVPDAGVEVGSNQSRNGNRSP